MAKNIEILDRIGFVSVVDIDITTELCLSSTNAEYKEQQITVSYILGGRKERFIYKLNNFFVRHYGYYRSKLGVNVCDIYQN